MTPKPFKKIVPASPDAEAEEQALRDLDSGWDDVSPVAIQFLNLPMANEVVAAETGITKGKLMAAAAPLPAQGGRLFDTKVEPGQNFQIANVEGLPLLRGVFSNVDLQKRMEDDKRILIGRIEAFYSGGHLKIKALDVNSPSNLNREKLKDAILKAKRAGTPLKEAIPSGTAEELRIDIDAKNAVMNSITSGNGPRCYVVDGNPSTKQEKIIDAGRIEGKKLSHNDIIVVMTRKVLDALARENSESMDAPSAMYDSEVVATLRSLVEKHTGKTGKLSVEKFYEDVAKIYNERMKTDQNYEAIASGMLVYQHNFSLEIDLNGI